MSREMKNSDVQWIGDIPTEWCTLRIKDVVTHLKSGGTPDSSNSQFYNETGVPWVAIGDMVHGGCICDTKKHLSREGIQDKSLITFPIGTLLYSIYASIGKVSILQVPATINQAILAISFTENYSSLFAKYVLMAIEGYVFSFANGNTQFNLNSSIVSNLPIPFTNLEEQQKIASFLDRKCSEIDEMIALQEKIVEELKAYKQSVITEAVTKGLNPDVPLQDSGIEWIGEIPEHWEVKRIKYIGKAENGLTYTPSDVCDASEGVLVLRSSNIQNGKLVFDDNVYVRAVPDSLIVRDGDIIICSRNGSASLVGKSAIVEGNITASFGAFMMRFRSNHNYKYINFLLTATISHYKQLFTTTTINQLTIGLVNNIAMPFIEDKEEQQNIADYLDKQCTEIDSLITIKQSKIDSLKEYKKSIIYEYVTGKKEVTE